MSRREIRPCPRAGKLTDKHAVGLVEVTMNPSLVTRVVEIGGNGNPITSVHMPSMITPCDNIPAVAMRAGCMLAPLAAAVLVLQTECKKGVKTR